MNDGLPRGYDAWRTATPDHYALPDLMDWNTHYSPNELDALTFDAVQSSLNETPAELASEYEVSTLTELVDALMDECSAQLKGIISGFEGEGLYLSWSDVKASLARVFAPVFVKAAA